MGEGRRREGKGGEGLTAVKRSQFQNPKTATVVYAYTYVRALDSVTQSAGTDDATVSSSLLMTSSLIAVVVATVPVSALLCVT